MKKNAFLAFVLAAVVALPASAQFAKPEDAIKYRRSSMSVLSTHFYRLANMVNGRTPYDPKAAAENAELVLAMSKLPWPAFAAGTDKGETRASPAIWTQQGKFKESSEHLLAEAVKLNAAAKTGNLDTLKVAFRATARTCQSCHDVFKTRGD
jgi:cytochrome c556